MSARTYIAAQLDERLPDWSISPDPGLPETVNQTVVVIEPGEITRVDGGRAVDTTLDAHLIVPARADRSKREDRLEDALDDLIAAIEAIPALTWTTARRTTLADTYHAYTIALAIRMGKEPPHDLDTSQ